MAVAQVLLLLIGSALAVVPWRRMPGWAGPAVLAVGAVAVRLVPFSAVSATTRDLTAAILFLLLAVPLAVLLDRSGFFTVLAGRIGGGKHLGSGLWVLAAIVVIVFNLDAAVVLLTPLYVRVADEHGEDPVMFGFMPAILAAVASSVLPVSNLTNLIVADRLDLSAGAFLAHLGLPSLVAVVVGGIVHARLTTSAGVHARTGIAGADRQTHPLRSESADAGALRVGTIVVVWLVLGFVIGERLGIPAWTVVACALIGLAIRQRVVPWRQVPFHAAALAAGLGVLATAAAEHLPIEQLLAIRGIPGELATISVVTLGANAINNLPAVLVMLHGLDLHNERVWAVLLGANVGASLWITGSLSSLLWQATMRRLGHPVTAIRFFRTAGRVGLASLAAAAAMHLLVVLAGRV